MKKLSLVSSVAGLFLFTVCISAASVFGAEFEAGVHYEVLPIPVETEDPVLVEVVEIFSYGCVHCFTFDPAIEEWRARQAPDIQFRRIPAIFNETWALFAQAYYTAQVLGVSDQVHEPIFQAVHTHSIDLRDPTLMAALFAETAQVDPGEFGRVFNSFSVRSRVQQATANGRTYRVTGVPSIVVNGKYRVDARMAGSNTLMLQVVDYLVGIERAVGVSD
ncbi:MAG: thiol:disulfide interchange protein DsbA/DsbL [Gammaproteobacteria bacterium]|nr:thiol:disulfide interchange protein DsbA/DsbL [Gammaproteobacteria bacterium]